MKNKNTPCKCSVCGHKFPIKKESVYQVQEQASLADRLNMREPTIFNAIDCPECGCQMLLKGRVPAVTSPEPEIEIGIELPEWKTAMLRTFIGGEC